MTIEARPEDYQVLAGAPSAPPILPNDLPPAGTSPADGFAAGLFAAGNIGVPGDAASSTQADLDRRARAADAAAKFPAQEPIGTADAGRRCAGGRPASHADDAADGVEHYRCAWRRGRRDYGAADAASAAGDAGRSERYPAADERSSEVPMAPGRWRPLTRRSLVDSVGAEPGWRRRRRWRRGIGGGRQATTPASSMGPPPVPTSSPPTTPAGAAAKSAMVTPTGGTPTASGPTGMTGMPMMPPGAMGAGGEGGK